MRTRDAFNYETISLLKWLYGINIAGEKCLCNEAKNAFGLCGASQSMTQFLKLPSKMLSWYAHYNAL